MISDGRQDTSYMYRSKCYSPGINSNGIASYSTYKHNMKKDCYGCDRKYLVQRGEMRPSHTNVGYPSMKGRANFKNAGPVEYSSSDSLGFKEGEAFLLIPLDWVDVLSTWSKPS